MSKKLKGKIKKILKEKNFGFIKTKDIDKDIFFHFNDIKNPRFIQKGVEVLFDLFKNKKGFVAKNILILEETKYIRKDLDVLLRENSIEISNLYLQLNKYAFAKFLIDVDVKNEDKIYLKDIELKIDKIPNIPIQINKAYFGTFLNNYEEGITNLKNKIYTIIDQKIYLDKLIIGLGNPSIYEVSMTLHHIYGFPYIPAQAIKGVLRNYFINEYFDLSEDKKKKIEDVKEISKVKENLAEENPIFKFIFGSQDSEGNIIFFDAFPVGDIKLQIDITNNHFPEYYKDDKNEIPPADWQNPNPVKFLVVKDTPFKVFIGIKRNVSLEKLEKKLKEFKEINENHKKFIEDFENKLDSQENLLNHLLNHLEKAFELYGIGAKTSVGYGYLSKEN